MYKSEMADKLSKMENHMKWAQMKHVGTKVYFFTVKSLKTKKEERSPWIL